MRWLRPTSDDRADEADLDEVVATLHAAAFEAPPSERLETIRARLLNEAAAHPGPAARLTPVLLVVAAVLLVGAVAVGAPLVGALLELPGGPSPEASQTAEPRPDTDASPPGTPEGLPTATPTPTPSPPASPTQPATPPPPGAATQAPQPAPMTPSPPAEPPDGPPSGPPSPLPTPPISPGPPGGG